MREIYKFLREVRGLSKSNYGILKSFFAGGYAGGSRKLI